MSREDDDSTEQHGCMVNPGQDITWHDPWGAEPDPEALIARLTGAPLPTTGLTWTHEHPDVPLARISLAQLAARQTLLVYLTPAEGATSPTADTMGRALRDLQDALHDLGVHTVGISTQPIAEQQEFADSELFTQRLLSDLDLVLANILGLSFTVVNARVEYRPIILIARRGRIAHVIYPIDSPRVSARDALDWLTRHITGGT